MPFAKRIISADHGGDEAVGVVGDVSEVSGLKSLCSLLLGLIQHADDLWGELASECQAVLHRTERIQGKIAGLSTVVKKLNARAVPIRKYN